jgi:hypothetical protein
VTNHATPECSEGRNAVQSDMVNLSRAKDAAAAAVLARLNRGMKNRGMEGAGLRKRPRRDPNSPPEQNALYGDRRAA